MEEDYTVFVHMLDEDGQRVTQHDAWPQAGNFPTSLWVAGEYVADDYAFVDDLAPGRYDILVGFYLASTGQRLILPDGTDFVVIQVEIR